MIETYPTNARISHSRPLLDHSIFYPKRSGKVLCVVQPPRYRGLRAERKSQGLQTCPALQQASSKQDCWSKKYVCNYHLHFAKYTLKV